MRSRFHQSYKDPVSINMFQYPTGSNILQYPTGSNMQQYHPTFISNPVTPYVGEIPGGLQNGTVVTIQGQTPHHQHNFSINLSVAPRSDPLPDTILHIDTRFNEHCIVRNAMRHGSWGHEDRHGGFPLRKGQVFEVIIMVNYEGFMIAFNGTHFTKFEHRYPKELGRYLVVKGHIFINFIKIDNSSAPTPAQPGFPPIMNPRVPLVTGIMGGCYPQKMIVIAGVPKPYKPKRFTVNLKAGCDVALHFDVRFCIGDTDNTVIRNSSRCGSWGSEERHQSYFPFSAGIPFEMMILVEHQCFKIAINNQHFTTFDHRLLPINSVNTLEVDGDVKLTMVRFQ